MDTRKLRPLEGLAKIGLWAEFYRETEKNLKTNGLSGTLGFI